MNLLERYVKDSTNVVVMVKNGRNENDRLDQWAEMCSTRGIAVYNLFDEGAGPNLINEFHDWSKELKHGAHAVRPLPFERLTYTSPVINDNKCLAFRWKIPFRSTDHVSHGRGYQAPGLPDTEILTA